MKIILIQKEIEEAIKAYAGEAINLEGRELEVDLTAGRGGNGFTAEISVTTTGSKVKLVETPSADAPMGVDTSPTNPEPGKIDSSKPLFGKAAEAKGA